MRLLLPLNPQPPRKTISFRMTEDRAYSYCDPEYSFSYSEASYEIPREATGVIWLGEQWCWVIDINEAALEEGMIKRGQ